MSGLRSWWESTSIGGKEITDTNPPYRQALHTKFKMHIDDVADDNSSSSVSSLLAKIEPYAHHRRKCNTQVPVMAEVDI